MPKNYLSSRYNDFLHRDNQYWDDLFCRLFWSPFAKIGEHSGTRTRSGCILTTNEQASTDSSDDDLAPIEIDFSNHDDWIFLEYPTEAAQSVPNESDDSRTDTASQPSDEDSDNCPKNSYKCGICSQRFEYLDQLSNHIKTHSNNRTHSCECGKAFKTRTYLGIHRRNTGHHNWTVKCPKCGKAFEKVQYMARHSTEACDKYLAKQKRQV